MKEEDSGGQERVIERFEASDQRHCTASAGPVRVPLTAAWGGRATRSSTQRRVP
jgi:hypothetical protein